MAEVELNSDIVVYIGKVAEWLRTAPDGRVSYGEYHLGDLQLCFDSEPICKIFPDGADWLFVFDN